MKELTKQQWDEIQRAAIRNTSLPALTGTSKVMFEKCREIAVNSAIEVLKQYQSHLDD